MTTNRVFDYLEGVAESLPPDWGPRESALRDLRLHIEAAVEAGADEAEALARLGPPSEVASSLLEDYRPTLAPISRRVVAFLVDLGIGWALLWASMATMGLGTGGEVLAIDRVAWLWWGWLLAAALLALLYFPWFEATHGQTPGKMLVGLHVVRPDGGRVSWKEAVIRRLPLFFEFFLLDALFAPFTERKQRAFDIVAGTVVVQGGDGGEERVPMAWLLAIGLWIVPLVYVAIVNNVV